MEMTPPRPTTSVTTLSLTCTKALPKDTDLIWRVRARRGRRVGAWSKYAGFRIVTVADPAAPQVGQLYRGGIVVYILQSGDPSIALASMQFGRRSRASSTRAVRAVPELARRKIAAVAVATSSCSASSRIQTTRNTTRRPAGSAASPG
jgi:hypothetical protein